MNIKTAEKIIRRKYTATLIAMVSIFVPIISFISSYITFLDMLLCVILILLSSIFIIGMIVLDEPCIVIFDKDKFAYKYTGKYWHFIKHGKDLFKDKKVSNLRSFGKENFLFKDSGRWHYLSNGNDLFKDNNIVDLEILDNRYLQYKDNNGDWHFVVEGIDLLHNKKASWVSLNYKNWEHKFDNIEYGNDDKKYLMRI